MKIKQIRVDGYKNLINSKLGLGDFNVLVGPNNSGKSNLLEVVQLLFPLCFGDDEIRQNFLRGYIFRLGSSISHLPKHSGKPLTIGINWESDFKGQLWRIDYEVKLQCSAEKEQGKIISELLQAKPYGKSGPYRNYIKREGKEFTVEWTSKNYKIAKDNSVFSAVKSIFPESKDLPGEFVRFYKNLLKLSTTSTFAFSPSALRKKLQNGEKADISKIRVSSFDLCLVLDELKQKDKKSYALFKETVCDVLEVDNVGLMTENIKPPEGKGDAKRIRFLFLKRKWDKYSPVQEYSDGTLMTIAILATFLSESPKENPILLLEELENCLHPRAVEKLLRFLQDYSYKRQVLITTHSPYILNGVNPEDVNISIADETGAIHFEKVKKSRKLTDYLNKSLMDFGDLLTEDFKGFREE
jgi:predicted ATPase